MQQQGPDEYPIILIDWVDACEPEINSDLSVEDAPEPQQVRMSGFLISNEECSVSIASAMKHDQGDTTFDYLITIPRCCVKRILVLEKGGLFASPTCGNCET
ncbi:MAG: hypothetical protein CL902_03000 [Dehalococcoidia bacterium]|jgi:hypothetical protein|nr:hypothetical protein [Dehalococcoidia bacterium]